MHRNDRGLVLLILMLRIRHHMSYYTLYVQLFVTIKYLNRLEKQREREASNNQTYCLDTSYALVTIISFASLS